MPTKAELEAQNAELGAKNAELQERIAALEAQGAPAEDAGTPRITRYAFAAGLGDNGFMQGLVTALAADAEDDEAAMAAMKAHGTRAGWSVMQIAVCESKPAWWENAEGVRHHNIIGIREVSL